MSRLSRINVASVLLIVIGGWSVLDGVMALLSPESYLDGWITMVNEGLRPATVSEISALGQNLVEFMTFIFQIYGLDALILGLFICVISLIPYRKGEKWAWYAMLVIGGIYMFGALIFTYIGMISYAPVTIVMVILWIVGLALPAKEILGKPS